MKKIIFLLLTVIATSCASVIINSELKKIGAFDSESKLARLSNGNKNVVFIGMHHIGRKEFYDDVAIKVDSLQKQNYTVFYESVAEEDNQDPMTSERYERKTRKILGFMPQEYLDTVNNKFLGKYKYDTDYKLINQPSYHTMKVDTNKSVKADIGLTTLVRAYETKYAEIKLDSCDLQTPIDDKNYNCDKVNKDVRKKFFDEFVIDYRNQHLAGKIQKHNSDKIAVIYGKSHLSGMVVELRKLDSLWDYVREKQN